MEYNLYVSKDGYNHQFHPLGKCNKRYMGEPIDDNPLGIKTLLHVPVEYSQNATNGEILQMIEYTT